ncbi:MAG: CoA transferase [Chloroflexi bacterium]|nr:CoA transferase [Chloroflexota bacterium]
MSSLPLDGVRLIDFTWVIAGPVCTRILGALGAEVIKIETRTRPELSRRDAYNYQILNASKKSITLDMKKPRARELARELVRHGDLVMENFGPGVMDRLGLSYAALKEVKPDIIMLSISGLGRTGPESGFVAYGTMIQCFALWNSLIGYPDQPPVVSGGWTDPITGTTSAYLLLAALYHHRLTGEGQYIDLSMAETTLSALPEAQIDYLMNNRIQRGHGNHDAAAAPHDCYRCRGVDQWVAIAVTNEREWQALGRAMGNPPWFGEERLADPVSRWHHQDEMRPLIEAWTRQRTYQEAMDQLQQAGVPAAAVYNMKDMAESPQMKERKFFAPTQLADGQPELLFSMPWLVDEKREGDIFRAPMLGEHNEYVFGELLGLSKAEIVRLVEEEVIY